MAVMEAVWPVTALYFGPLAWWGYRRWGRLNSPRYQRQTGAEPEYGERVSVSVVSHCGAGCTLSGRSEVDPLMGHLLLSSRAHSPLRVACPRNARNSRTSEASGWPTTASQRPETRLPRNGGPVATTLEIHVAQTKEGSRPDASCRIMPGVRGVILGVGQRPALATA
jgi:hypothetical protein